MQVKLRDGARDYTGSGEGWGTGPPGFSRDDILCGPISKHKKALGCMPVRLYVCMSVCQYVCYVCMLTSWGLGACPTSPAPSRLTRSLR